MVEADFRGQGHQQLGGTGELCVKSQEQNHLAVCAREATGSREAGWRTENKEGEAEAN